MYYCEKMIRVSVLFDLKKYKTNHKEYLIGYSEAAMVYSFALAGKICSTGADNGMILASQASEPGSIPGGRNYEPNRE